MAVPNASGSSPPTPPAPPPKSSPPVSPFPATSLPCTYDLRGPRPRAGHFNTGSTPPAPGTPTRSTIQPTSTSSPYSVSPPGSLRPEPTNSASEPSPPPPTPPSSPTTQPLLPTSSISTSPSSFLPTPAPQLRSRSMDIQAPFPLPSTSIPFASVSAPHQAAVPAAWCSRTSRPLDIVINEFTPRPSSPTEAFIELLNTSERYISIEGWTIGRSSSFRTLSHSRAIAPGDFVVVQRDPPPDSQSETAHFVEASIFPLGMTTDRLFIRDADGQLIDSVFYSPPHSSDWISGNSIEKKSPLYSGMDPKNWSQHPVQNSRGDQNRAEPLTFDSESPSMSVSINSNTITVLFDRFVQWSPESEFVVNSNQLEHPEFNPFSSNNLHIPTPVDITLHNSTLVFGFDNGLSFDGRHEFSVQQEAAQPPRPNDLFLNEILYQPLQDRYASQADQSEFIEIYNNAPWKISLADVIIRDPIDKNGDFPSISPENPEIWSIPAKGYALLVPDTSASILNSRTAQFFGIEPDETWGHVNRSGLSLSTSGKPLILSLKDGTTLDSISYTPDMHNPLLREQKGISLERVGGYSSSSQVKWTSSADPLGATPGFVNSVSVSSPELKNQTGFQFYPNPFSPDHDGVDDVVEIKLFSENIDHFSRITIYDIRGRRIKTVLNDGLTGRITSATWDGTDDRGILSPTGVFSPNPIEFLFQLAQFLVSLERSEPHFHNETIRNCSYWDIRLRNRRNDCC